MRADHRGSIVECGHLIAAATLITKSVGLAKLGWIMEVFLNSSPTAVFRTPFASTLSEYRYTSTYCGKLPQVSLLLCGGWSQNR